MTHLPKTFILFFLFFVIQNIANAQSTTAIQAAENALTLHDYKAAFKAAQEITEPKLKLWQSLLQAESYLGLEQPQSVLASLRQLKDWPKPSLSNTEDGYLDLFKRAHIVVLRAKRALNKPTTYEATTLSSVFPLDKSIATLLTDEEKAYPLFFEQRLEKLHRLSFKYAFKYTKGLVTPAEIQTSKLKTNEKCEAYYTLGRSIKGFKEHWEDARKSLELLLDTKKCNDDLKAKSLYYLGSLGRAAKNDDLIVQSYKTLHTLYPKHRLADDAIYYLMFYYKNSSRTLHKKYLKLLDEATAGDMRMIFHFDEGMKEYKNQKFAKAEKHFEKINENTAPINEVFTQGLYWWGRSLDQQDSKKKKAEAQKIFKRITKEYPFSFYAVLAAKQSGVDLSIPKLPQWDNIDDTYAKEHFALIDEFNSLGFDKGARVILDQLVIENPTAPTTHPHLFGKKYLESKNYREAIDVAANFFDSGVYGPLTPQKDALFSAFYPLAFEQEIRKGYELSSLPFGAIEGITREESLFKYDATSWAGARGLMQLMPTTAQMIQNNVIEHSLSTELTNPLNNILLGSHYLKRMQDRFDGQLPLAIMAYNAGPGNVNKWLRTLKKDPSKKNLDLFIEEIPFSETRGYVKRVMRTMHVYGAFYKEEYFEKKRFSMLVSP